MKDLQAKRKKYEEYKKSSENRMKAKGNKNRATDIRLLFSLQKSKESDSKR